MEATHEFRLLGPLEAYADGLPVDLGGPKQRAVLALLLLRVNEVVPRDRLIDELWGDVPPPTARETLKVYVGRLRKQFPADGRLPRLATRGGGYVLEVEPDRLDLVRFQRRVEEASRATRDADPEGAAESLREALALFRGTPLADVGDAPFARPQRDRLEELRLAALEERLDVDLALGRQVEVAWELEGLVSEYPFRERFRAQLMLALYRCDRQVEALRHYRRAARVFATELGIEPGPDLRALERAILEHDPSLRLVRLADPNLPSPPSRLIGRERELGEVLALLEEHDRRLVTVVGTGGAGKTRLALEAAGRASLPTYFVDLSPLADPRSVLPAIARTVGFDDGATPLAESVATFLGRRRLLLLLDNFEHLLEAAKDVATLLSAAPAVTVLATSRSPLRVRAEWRYDLGPLEVDAAVALFLERARAVGGDPSRTDAVEELCRRLDSVPLPIELAAARADRQTPEAMLAALDESFAFPGDGARDLPDRQRTLRATIDWSYALLDEPARELLARLAVFAGGCTQAAAARVCDARAELLHALADAALLRNDGERILMLETIRAYALDRLEESGDEQTIRGAHAHYYVDLVEAARTRLGRASTVAGVAAEDDNIRAALRWTSGQRDVDLHLRLVVGIAPFWSVLGQSRDADIWLRPAVGLAAGAAPALRASVLSAAANIAGRIGDLTRAGELAAAAWELHRACGDNRGAAAALTTAMTTATRAGDRARRDALLEQLDRATRELADPVLRAGALRAFGATVARAGDHERGRGLVEESLAIARAADLELDVGQALCHLGVIALQADRADEARAPLAESLEIARKLTYREAAAYSISGLAAVAVAEDDLARAGELLAAADALFDDVGTSRLPFIDDVDARTRAAVVEALGDEGFARARAEAGESTFDELAARGIAVAHR